MKNCPKKVIISFVFTLVVFLFSPKLVLAQVVINEFSSDTAGTTADPDWVEFYNTSDSSVDLSQFRIEDYGATNKKTLSGEITAKGFLVVDWSNKLNKDGDEISLIKISDGSVANKVGYENKGTDVSAPASGESAGRGNDGGLNWVIFSTPSKGSSNNTATPAPSSSPTSSPTPTGGSLTPTPTSSPSKATYKINEVKDEDGNPLSNVKINVDGNYIHHYAPETLNFCQGCDCYVSVSCGFGSHTISLEKSGYKNWSQVKLFASGDSFEVDPVMILNTSSQSDNSSPTVAPAKSSAPQAGKSATPKETSQAVGSNLPGAILGEEEESSESGEATISALPTGDSASSPSDFIATAASRQKYAGGAFLIFGGISLLIGSTIAVWKKKESVLSFFGHR